MIIRQICFAAMANRPNIRCVMTLRCTFDADRTAAEVVLQVTIDPFNSTSLTKTNLGCRVHKLFGSAAGIVIYNRHMAKVTAICVDLRCIVSSIGHQPQVFMNQNTHGFYTLWMEPLELVLNLMQNFLYCLYEDNAIEFLKIKQFAHLLNFAIRCVAAFFNCYGPAAIIFIKGFVFPPIR